LDARSGAGSWADLDEVGQDDAEARRDFPSGRALSILPAGDGHGADADQLGELSLGEVSCSPEAALLASPDEAPRFPR
jgi:hypothetical protein